MPTLTGGPDGPVTFWPRVLLIWASCFSILLAVGCFVGWFALDPAVRERFTAFQVVTLLLIAAILIGIMMSLGLSRVRADREGLRIRNGIASRRLRWSEVGAIQYRYGDPWAYVILAGTEDDPVRRPMIAIQSTDGDRAHAAVATLQAMYARYRSG
jgi:hypothetical protein